MSAVDLSLSFDDLMQAVKESSRGRWFLEEYESRLRQSDTGNILAAIAKLENVIATSGPVTGDSALVSRAKAAIAAARSEIASLNQHDIKLSDEARLFAKLAEMARAIFPAETPVSAGVNRALKLVDQLEQEFSVPVAPITKTEFFAQDADVFETSPKVQSASAQVSAPVAASTEVERGAKLTIRKSSIAHKSTLASETNIATHNVASGPGPDSEISHFATNSPKITPEEAAPVDAAPMLNPTVQQMIAPEPRRSRVVIVRRRPEELQELPMVPGEDESSSAA